MEQTRQQINTTITRLGVRRSELDLVSMPDEIRQTKKEEIDAEIARLNKLLESKGEDDEADERTEN